MSQPKFAVWGKIKEQEKKEELTRNEKLDILWKFYEDLCKEELNSSIEAIGNPPLKLYESPLEKTWV